MAESHLMQFTHTRAAELLNTDPTRHVLSDSAAFAREPTEMTLNDESVGFTQKHQLSPTYTNRFKLAGCEYVVSCAATSHTHT